MAVSILAKGPGWARVRASWLCVQRASCEPRLARSTRRNGLVMDGGENVLFTLAKAYHRGSGIWLIKGDSQRDGSDVTRAIERMRAAWSPAPRTN
jgi:hypothetical protein